jgi:hypothetical protein
MALQVHFVRMNADAWILAAGASDGDSRASKLALDPLGQAVVFRRRANDDHEDGRECMMRRRGYDWVVLVLDDGHENTMTSDRQRGKYEWLRDDRLAFECSQVEHLLWPNIHRPFIVQKGTDAEADRGAFRRYAPRGPGALTRA